MPIAIQPPTLRIPAIDLSPTSGHTDAERAATLLDALNTVGFLHVLNPGPGLTQDHVRQIFSVGEQLFQCPLEDKEAVGFDIASGAGYTSMMGQLIGNKAGRIRGDLKESFSIGPDTKASIPRVAPADLVPTLEAFRKACFECGLALLDLFSLALKTPEGDRKYFSKRHGYGHNESLRLLHYPGFPAARRGEEGSQGKQTKWDELKIAEKDIRAGAHQDFGSATLLFQSPPDEEGNSTAVEGLEIFVARPDGPSDHPDQDGTKGWWVPAPKPDSVGKGGSILVNVGVCMQIWSGRQFRATWHRVICPPLPAEDDAKPDEILPGRKSVVFFMIPDNETLLTPVDQSGLPAVAEGCISAGEYFKLRMARSYVQEEKKA